jgi:hypothetical protein
MAPAKRWMTVAAPSGAGWQVTNPEPVGPPEILLARLLSRAEGAPVALGIDCPIGLPHGFATRHVTAPDFPSFLRGLDPSSQFFSVATKLSDCGPGQPFYPARGMRGMTRLAHALALGFDTATTLSRACDRATAERPAGAPLFWTLGANQTGKAAICAWRDMLIPALHSPTPPRLWPFEGGFLSLLTPGTVAVAETYPAEAMRHLGIKPAGSKRRQPDRAAYAGPLARAMAALAATPDPNLIHAMADGFGPGDGGEDKLDSLFGVLCVLGVLRGVRPDTAPDDPAIRRWEGWVLGQTALPC